MTRVAALVALCLLAACSSAGTDGAAGISVPRADGATSTVADSEGEPAGSTTTSVAAGADGVTSTTAGSPAPTDAVTTTVAAAPPVATPAPAPGAVGSFGRYYLAAGGAAELQIDLRVQASVAPDAAAVQRLRDVLAREAGKPVAVTTGSVSGDRTDWSADAIRTEADRGRPGTGAGTGVLTVLYLAGGFAESDTSLGVAVRSDVAAVFPDRIDEAAGVFGDPRRIETAVVVHELGHLLGLVDLELDTGRADPEHPGHSPNRGSVMYYAVESTLVGDLLSGGPPTEFDAADRRDLATIAGR